MRMMKNMLYLIISLMILTACGGDDNDSPLTPPETETPAENGSDNGSDNENNNGSESNTNSNKMKMTIGDATFTATLADNATAKAFKAMLPLTLNMNEFNGNEKYCSLPNSLTTNASNPGTIHTGDIMLYGSSSIVLFYETFSTSYSYTRLGQVDNVSGLKAALGSGSITIKMELE